MDRTNHTSNTKHERLVGPIKGLSPAQQAYWDEYDALVHAYVRAKGGAIEPEGIFGLDCLGNAPWAQIEGGDPWPLDWSYRFDAQALANIHGRELLMKQIAEGGLMEGDDETVIVDEIAAFVAWLGREGHVPAAMAERFGNEIAEARPEFVENMAEKADDGLWQDREPEAAAGPFVYYLRTVRGYPMDKLLLGQSLCVDALEQLHSAAIEDASWSMLDLPRCMQYTARQLPFLNLTKRDLDEMAKVFLDWLVSARYLSPSAQRRLR